MILLSICIPTYNRPLILKEVLESIFSQNVDSSLYEVCISDNAQSNENKKIIDTYFQDKKNLVYNHSTCEGFYNSIESLKLGHGKYLKLNNDTGIFRKNALERLIKTIQSCNEATIFFPMKDESNDASISFYNDFNAFLFEISYLSTWSSAFCISQTDFNRCLQEQIQVDKMFPHTSLLFSLTNADKYIVDNYKYIDTFEVAKKGGYNIPEAFGFRYINMVKQLYDNGVITTCTLKKVKADILNFIAEWYIKVLEHKEKYTFSYANKTHYIRISLGIVSTFSFYAKVLKIKMQHLKGKVKKAIKRIVFRKND